MSLSLKPFRWDWPCIVAEDTFPPFEIALTSEPDSTALTRVRMQIRDSEGVLFYTADSEESGVTITDPATYAMSFDEITAPSGAGVYLYDIEITTSAVAKATIVSGTWQILPQVTLAPEPAPEP
jgi:hypothetical protein